LIKHRNSGILLHITSLPSPYGIGDIGPEAYRFADMLKSSRTGYWQILPLSPTSHLFDYSPYSGLSAFAGNTMLISPDLLHEEGLLEKEQIERAQVDAQSKVDFDQAVHIKSTLLDEAWKAFEYACGFNDKTFLSFWKEHALWLDDYATFIAISEKYRDINWLHWPDEYRNKKGKAINRIKKELEGRILKEKFLQFVLFKQWQKLRDYCHANGISIFGDLPFYVSHYSADVWGFPSYFKLGPNKEPVSVSGVPPDYFSEEGQLWNTPVFNWNKLKKHDFDWWTKRIMHNFKFYDLLRLDHFRAFSEFWEVPAGSENAINGKWTKTPGTKFFKKLKSLGVNDQIIAEDLGDIDMGVTNLMEKFGLPGMKVLQFAFDLNEGENEHIPHHHVQNAVVYSGTHDNNTSRGWYARDASASALKILNQYSGKKITEENVHMELVRMCFASVAGLAVIPIQDLLGLGAEAKMNRPGTASGNWRWRLTKDQISAQHIEQLRELNEIYGRTSSNIS